MERKMKKIGSTEFPKDVDWENVKELKGVVGDQRIISIGGQNRECLTLETENGQRFTIWSSKGLLPLFRMKEGVYVEIKNLGMKEMRAGRKMRLFDIFADEEQLKIPF